MKNTIEIYTKNVYGIENIYIKDEEIARIISTLTGKKTVNTTDIEALKELGFDFKVVLANSINL